MASLATSFSSCKPCCWATMAVTTRACLAWRVLALPLLSSHWATPWQPGCLCVLLVLAPTMTLRMVSGSAQLGQAKIFSKPDWLKKEGANISSLYDRTTNKCNQPMMQTGWRVKHWRQILFLTCNEIFWWNLQRLVADQSSTLCLAQSFNHSLVPELKIGQRNKSACC